MDEDIYKFTLNVNGHRLDGEDLIYALVRHLSVPLVLLTISKVVGWKQLLHDLVVVKYARKWADDIYHDHGVTVDPILDIRAQAKGEYLEWVPDGKEIE